MSNISGTKKMFDARFKPYLEKANLFIAVVGLADGTIDVPDRDGWVYVRDINGGTHEAFNPRSVVKATDAVWVGINTQPLKKEVLEIYGLVDVSNSPVVQVPPHNHSWDAPNTTFVDANQLMPFLASPTTGAAFSVDIHPGVDYIGGQWVWLTKILTVDLTPYVPTSGAVFALISLDSAGVLSVTVGTSAPSVYALTATNFPTIVIEKSPRALVRLYAGQKKIRQTKKFQDLIDTRWIYGIATGGAVGDMLKSVYDTDHNGIVDNASALSGAVLDTDGALAANSDARVPSQKAVKTFVAASAYTPPATTAVNDFQVGNGSGYWVKKTLAETVTILRTSLDTVYQATLGYTAENTANKETGSAPTDNTTKYPSSHTVYTALATKQASLLASSPIQLLSGYILYMPPATTSANGYLSSSDWNTFNNKIGATGGSMTGTLTISVPTTTKNALVLKTSDDVSTKNIIELQNSVGAAKFWVNSSTFDVTTMSLSAYGPSKVTPEFWGSPGVAIGFRVNPTYYLSSDAYVHTVEYYSQVWSAYAPSGLTISTYVEHYISTLFYAYVYNLHIYYPKMIQIATPNYLQYGGGVLTINAITGMEVQDLGHATVGNSYAIHILDQSSIGGAAYAFYSHGGYHRFGSASALIGFFGAAAIVQPTTAIAPATFVQNSGTPINDASTFGGYTMAQFAAIIKNLGLAA